MAVFSLAAQAKPHSLDVIQSFLSISRTHLGISACACSKHPFACVPSLRTHDEACGSSHLPSCANEPAGRAI